MNLFQEIKTNLSYILGESTAYGVPKIFKSKRNFFKIFWFIFVIFGCISSIYIIYNSINNYLKHEVIPQFEFINENPMQFPTLTFCSNYFQRKSLKEIIKTCFFDKDVCNFENFQMFLNDIN